MRKILPAIACLILAIGCCRAQDQLFNADNTKLLVKVLEIGPDFIKYRLHANPDGPIYSVKREDVVMIIYESGIHEIITKKTETPARERDYQVDYRRDSPKQPETAFFKSQNNISLNIFSFLNNEVSFLYSREFPDKNFFVKVPFSFGVERPVFINLINSNTYNSSVNIKLKRYDVGLGINYYPAKQGVINYYIGPMFRYMEFNAVQSYNSYSFPSSTNISKSVLYQRYTASITNGAIIRTRSRLTINTFFSFGFKKDEIKNPIVDPKTGQKINPLAYDVSFYSWLGFNVGFSF